MFGEKIVLSQLQYQGRMNKVTILSNCLRLDMGHIKLREHKGSNHCPP